MSDVGKTKGVAKFIWLIIGTVVSFLIVSFFISGELCREVVMGDIVSVNYRMMNLVGLVKSYVEQNLLYTSVEIARQLGRYEANWDESFRNSLSAEFSPDYRVGFFMAKESPPEIIIKNIQVDGRNISVDYRHSHYYEYRTLEKDETVRLVLPCMDYYYTKEECPAVCGWCDKCQNAKTNAWHEEKCLDASTDCGYRCETGYCGAHCDQELGHSAEGSVCWYGTCCHESCNLGECCDCTDGGCTDNDSLCDGANKCDGCSCV